MPADKFSLKDHLFNTQNVTRIANEILAVYPQFPTADFVSTVCAEFPSLELMERLYWVRECLGTYLPKEYEKAVVILLESLPPPLDPSLSDNDFGDYIYGAYGNFVSHYGATKERLQFSLTALKDMTTRFSCEFPIRTFINTYPQETLAALQLWSTDSHYHVRRLVSEGTRPKLPWAKKITLDYTEPIMLLDVLHTDSTRFVTRSVANHLNDISKIDPDLVIKTLQRWQNRSAQNKKELDYIVRHSLRTLVKQGYQPALNMLGYSPARVSADVSVSATPVKNGGELEFTCIIVSQSDIAQELLIDYVMYYQKANGTLAPKTFKITKVTLQSHAELVVSKKHSFKTMSTRKHYVGAHQLELQINGQLFGKQDFVLVH